MSILRDTVRNLALDDAALAKLDGLRSRGVKPSPKDISLNSLFSQSQGPNWPEPINQEALTGWTGRLVDITGPNTEADPMAILTQALVMTGCMAGRHCYYQVEADRHYGNEFCVMVGDSAKGRKGTSAGIVKNVLSKVDGGDATPETSFVKNNITSGVSSGEGVIWAVRDPIRKMEKEGKGANPQLVEVDPGVTDKRLVILEPEFASVLRQTERDGNIVSPVLRSSWDSGDLRTMTKNSPAKATGAHISMIGHITADEFRRHLNTTDIADGFANRFLIVCVRRSKVLPFGGNYTDRDRQQLNELGRELPEVVAWAKDEREITMDGEAREAWISVYPALSEGRAGLFGACVSRAEAHVVRLALIYSILDRSPQIRIQHLKAALAVWQYCESSAEYVFGNRLGDPVADAIAEALTTAGDVGMSRTEISKLFQRHRSETQIVGALGLLERFHRAHVQTVETGGRPEQRWFVGGGEQ